MASKSTRQYAKAIFESYSPEELPGLVDVYSAMAAAFLETKEYQDFFVNPAISYEDKNNVLISLSDTFFSGDQKLKNSLRVLLDNDKVKILPDIACELKRIYDEYRKSLQLNVTTAKETKGEEKESILGYLKQNFGNEVSIQWSIDPKLIGGFTVKSGDQVLDSSVSGALSKIKKSLVI